MTPLYTPTLDVEAQEGHFVERRGWRLDRSINLPTVFAVVGMLIAAFAYIKQQEQRTALAEAAIVGLVKEDTRLEAKIDSTTSRIENKLDRVIERR